METWYKAAKRYPGEGASVAVILTYLSFGPDYPYHISKLLKPHIISIKDHGIECRGLGSLCHANLTSEFMRNLALDNFIISDDTLISKNKRIYYKLNPAILNNPIKPMSFGSKFNIKLNKVIPDRLIQELLQAMYADRLMRYRYFRYSIHRMDFITFLNTLKESAVRHNMNIAAKKLDWYILETLTEKENSRIELMAKCSNTFKGHTIRTNLGVISFNKD